MKENMCITVLVRKGTVLNELWYTIIPYRCNEIIPVTRKMAMVYTNTRNRLKEG